MEKEEWRDINDYKGLYQVSSFGRVKSLDRIVYRNGSAKRIKGKTRKLCKTIHGYLMVDLYINGARKMISVHRIVLNAFKSTINKSLQVNHINCVRSDNRVINLEWCTKSQNEIHAHKNKNRKYPVGEKSGGSKLSHKDVCEILILSENGIARPVLSEMYSISIRQITSIRSGNSWSYITN